MFHDLSAACRRLVGRASARRRRRGNVGNDHDGLGETVRAMRRFPTRGRGVGTSRRFRHPLWASWAIPLPAGHAKNGGCGLFRLIMGRRRRKHVAAETCRSRGFVAGGVAEALSRSLLDAGVSARRVHLGNGRGMWEQVWDHRLEVRVFSYGVLVPRPSTTSRMRGDLDVRVPRRSARARASVRRWPWSSRRGQSVQVKLVKMGGRLVWHARRLIFQLSEGVLDRIGRLSLAPN